MKLIAVPLMILSLVLVGLVTVSDAQAAEIRGTVQRVDVTSGIVYLTDGRAVRVDPGTRLYADGREVRLADIKPGWTFVSSNAVAAPGAVATPGAVAPGTVVTQPVTPPAQSTASSTAMAAPGSARVDATGVVASVDPRSGTITLQDGRVVRMSSGTTLWQPVTIGSIAPGASLFVRNAEPLDFRPASAPQNRSYQMGTVSSVDASNARVILSDGTIVHMSPGSRIMFNGQPLAIASLHPGDEIAVAVPVTTVTPGASGVSALPRQTAGIMETDYLYIVRRPQSP